MLSAKGVEEFLAKDGWPYERIDENTWRSGFRGDVNSFRFFVRLTDNWIFFTIVPFVVAPKNDECALQLYRHLLRLNREINMAKFAIDDDADVVLTVELPTENIDESEFKDALDALSYYADRHYLEVLNLAQLEPRKQS
jgi:Putative bacterial sensory transduction regulator